MYFWKRQRPQQFNRRVIDVHHDDYLKWRISSSLNTYMLIYMYHSVAWFLLIGLTMVYWLLDCWSIMIPDASGVLHGVICLGQKHLPPLIAAGIRGWSSKSPWLRVQLEGPPMTSHALQGAWIPTKIDTCWVRVVMCNRKVKWHVYWPRENQTGPKWPDWRLSLVSVLWHVHCQLETWCTSSYLYLSWALRAR